MIIQHNMVADIANRQFNINNNNSAKNAERLSSGYRVNRAADNAAGLAISEKMRSQVRGLNRASENASDGISLLRTADGAINESQAIIHRLRELSVQAANDTNTLADRENIQEEINALIDEVDRVAFDTEFNTIKLLDGSCEGEASSNLVSAVGAADDITWVTVSSNPTGFQTGSVASGATSAQEAKLKEVLKNSIVPNVTNAVIAKFSSLSAQVNAGNVSPTIGFSYDSSNPSVLASVTIGYGYYSDGTVAPNSFSLGLKVNSNALKYEADGTLNEASRTALEATIAHEMMHAFMDDVLTPGMIGISNGKLDASNKFPKWFVEGMAQTLSGAFDPANPWCGTYKGKSVSEIQSLVTSSDRQLSRAATNNYGAYSTGYLASMYLGYMASGSSSVDANSIASGIDKILGDMIGGKTLNDVIKDISGGKYNSYKDFEKKFGDLDSANFIHSLTAAVGTGNGSILTGDLTQNDLISNGTGTSTVYVIDDTQAMTPSPTPHAPNSGGSGGGGAAGNLLHLQIGANTEQSMSISIADCRAEALGLTDISVLSHEGATEAIDKCDSALDKLSGNRTQIGAYTNRLEYAVKNDDNAGENMQAAESVIRDTDMASEMTQYSKNNILSQASQSMLAQAMSINESVLQLLQ